MPTSSSNSKIFPILNLINQFVWIISAALFVFQLHHLLLSQDILFQLYAVYCRWQRRYLFFRNIRWISSWFRHIEAYLLGEVQLHCSNQCLHHAIAEVFWYTLFCHIDKHNAKEWICLRLGNQCQILNSLISFHIRAGVFQTARTYAYMPQADYFSIIQTISLDLQPWKGLGCGIRNLHCRWC